MQNFSMDEISAHDVVDTVRSGLLVLTADLTIVSANSLFFSMFNTNASETIGRRLFHLGNGQWNIPRLRLLLEEILPQENTVEAFEVEHNFPLIGLKVMLLNARKVTRPGNQVAAFLLAIEDVTEARLGKLEAEAHWKLAQNIVDTIRDPLVILEADMTVVTASRSFLQMFNATSEEAIGHSLESLGQGQWDVAVLRTLLDRVVPDDQPIDGFLLEDEFPGLGRRIFKINARKVHRPGNERARLMVVFEDATAATVFDRQRDVLASELAHRIKNSLQVISSFVSYEIRRAADPCLDGFRAMQTRIAAVAELYDVIARSSAFGPVAMQTYLEGIASSMRSSLLEQSSTIEIKVDAEALEIQPDHAVPLGLMVNELTTNAVKYAFPEKTGAITLGFQRRDGEVTLTVSDDGVGVNASSNRSGMGSRFVEAFVQQVGGSLAMATGAAGTTFTVRLPESVLVSTLE